MKVRVCVTQDHIDNGEPHEADRCPIALALLGLGFVDVEVSDDHVKCFQGVSPLQARLPHTAEELIKRFDQARAHITVEPLEFEIDLEAPEPEEDDEDDDDYDHHEW